MENEKGGLGAAEVRQRKGGEKRGGIFGFVFVRTAFLDLQVLWGLGDSATGGKEARGTQSGVIRSAAQRSWVRRVEVGWRCEFTHISKTHFNKTKSRRDVVSRAQAQ